MIAFTAGPGFQVTGIGTGLGFGQCKRAEHCTASQRWQELLFLRFGAVLENRHTPHRVVHTHDRGARTITGGDFFKGHGIGLIARVATTPLFRHQHAEKAQLRHFVNRFAGETMLLVPLGGKGLQAFLGKLSCCFAYL